MYTLLIHVVCLLHGLFSFFSNFIFTRIIERHGSDPTRRGLAHVALAIQDALKQP